MTEERWRTIPEFSNYLISDLGRVYNTKKDIFMRTSLTNHGHVKLTFKDDWSDDRYTRSIALLVAEAFVEPINFMCDSLIILDGNFLNVAATNIAWRPRHHAWKYSRQLKVHQPIYYKNLEVHNLVTDSYYDSIIEAGMIEGLLFEDIWRSTYTGAALFPQGFSFEIVERV